jgi:hypothetical protein
MLVLFLINFPKNPPELLVLYGVSILMIIPVITTYNSPPNQMVKITAVRKKVYMGWLYLAVTIFFLVVVRRIIFGGISFS